MKKLDRRNFIRKTSLAGAAITMTPTIGSAAFSYTERPFMHKYMGDFAAPKLEKVRAAFIGVGRRGPSHLKFFAGLEGTEVVAICDLYEDFAKKWSDKTKEIGKSKKQHQNIKLYYGDENKWRTMLDEVKPDVVFVVTDWASHAPMVIEAMKKGAHAFTEVPMALTIKEMWDIVDTSEATGKHCMMMENVNYNREELMYLNMCRQGVIGELLHGEAAYIHELRGQMHDEKRGTGSWRTPEIANNNGNLYPTHGLGPVAQYMNLCRTDDNFKSLISYSSPSRGRKLYEQHILKPDNKWHNLKFKGGDINTSIVKTQIGRTIMIQWDETSPRPYTRHNLIQGTKGILAGFPNRIALDGGVPGITKDHHEWVEGDKLAAIYEKYDHPLYKRLNEAAKDSGHGGMDGIMMYRIVECLQKGLPLDQNVYEGAFWSAITPLSEASVESDGMPQYFPDFTRGNWKNTKPLNIVS